MHFLAIFLHLCVVIVIPNIHVKDHFDWPIRLFLRVMWICPSFWLNLWWPHRGAKTAILLFLGFLKIKNSWASFRLIFENSWPKGFSWHNMKKSLISVLKMNSQYFQSSALNDLFDCTLAYMYIKKFSSCYMYALTICTCGLVSHTLQEFLVLTCPCRIKSAFHFNKMPLMNDLRLLCMTLSNTIHDHHNEESRILMTVCTIYCNSRRYGNANIVFYFLVVKTLQVSKIYIFNMSK